MADVALYRVRSSATSGGETARFPHISEFTVSDRAMQVAKGLCRSSDADRVTQGAESIQGIQRGVRLLRSLPAR